MNNEDTTPDGWCKAVLRASGAALVLIFLGCPWAGAAAAADPGRPAVEVTAGKVNPAEVLIEQGTFAMRTDPEVSRRDAESALALLQKDPDPDLEIRARLLLCDYQSERDTAAAQRQIQAATALLPRAKRPGLRAGILNCEGESLENSGDNTKAMAYYTEAVSVATAEHDDEMLAFSLYSRGYLLGVNGDYANGLIELRRADALFEKQKKPLHALTTLNSIATLYNRMGDYVEARHIYTSALEQQRAAGLQREQVVTLHNLGRANENLHEWAAARAAFSEALEIARKIDYRRGESYALRGLAAVSNALGDPTAALDLLQKAEAFQNTLPDARLRAQIQLARGVALHQLRRFTESVASLQSALEVFKQADSLYELNQVYSELAAVDAETGNWQDAYGRLADAKATSDKLLRNQLDQGFATLKVEFDTATRDKENAALQREIAQQNSVHRLQATVLVLAVSLVLLLTLLAVFQHRSTLRMHTLAMTDELTGVPNRRAVLQRLDRLLRQADAQPCAILIIDIDYFKAINDQLGHSTGDEVLKVVAATLRAEVGEPAFFGRLGGEEFLIVLPDMQLTDANAAAERFCDRIRCIDTVRWFDDRRRITCSIGVSVSVPGRDTPSTMLQRADAALYSAKRGGRNCVRTEATTEPDVGTAAVVDA